MVNQTGESKRPVQTLICPVCETCHGLPLCPAPTSSEENSGTLGELITREQFDAEALAIEAKLPLLQKLREQGIPYDELSQRLKDDLHAHMGVEPVQMFRRVPITKVADPEKAKKFREWAKMPAVTP